MAPKQKRPREKCYSPVPLLNRILSSYPELPEEVDKAVGTIETQLRELGTLSVIFLDCVGFLIFQTASCRGFLRYVLGLQGAVSHQQL